MSYTIQTKESNQNMFYTTYKNCHTQNIQIVIHNIDKFMGLVSHKKVTHASVATAACPPFTNKIQIDSFQCLVFVVTSVSITDKETVCPVADTAEMV